MKDLHEPPSKASKYVLQQRVQPYIFLVTSRYPNTGLEGKYIYMRVCI